MAIFKDLGDSAEDARIGEIGRAAMSVPLGNMIALITDAKPPSKVERYKKKLLARFPKLKSSTNSTVRFTALFR